MEPIYAFVKKMGAEFDVSGRESACMREQDTGISKKKKKSGCMCSRLILHQGRSGTYLSQQGEAGEG